MTTPDTLNPYEQIWQSRDLKALESTPIKLNNKRPEWKKGLNAFVDEMQGTGYGLAALASQGVENVVGPNDITKGITDWGLEGYRRNMEESQSGANAPKIARVEDAHTASDAMDWASFQLGKGLPMLASLAVPAAIGGTIARFGAKEGVAALAKSAVGDTVKKAVATKALQAAEGDVVTGAMKQAAAKALQDRIAAGAVTGGYLGSFGLEGGQAFGEQVAQGAAPEDAVKSAIAVGGINGALEFLPFYSAAKSIGLGQYAKKGIMDIIKSDAGLSKKAIQLAGELGGRAVKGGIVGAGAEGITEGLQELTSIAGERWAKNDPLFADLSEDDWSRVKNSMAAGALVGGTAMGAGAMLKGPRKTGTPTDDQQGGSSAGGVTAPPTTREQEIEELRNKISTELEAAIKGGNTVKAEQLVSARDKLNAALGRNIEPPAQQPPAQEAPAQEPPAQEPIIQETPVQQPPVEEVIPSRPGESIQMQRGEEIILTPPQPGETEARVVPTEGEKVRLQELMGERPEGKPQEGGDVKYSMPLKRPISVADVSKIAREPVNNVISNITFGNQTLVNKEENVTKRTTARGKDYNFNLYEYDLQDGRKRLVLSAGDPENYVDAGAVIRFENNKPVIEMINADDNFENLGYNLTRQIIKRFGIPIKDESGSFSEVGAKHNAKLPQAESMPVAQEATIEEFEAVRKQFQERQKQETPFKNWFGKGTKDITANADGTPITLYHGTNNPTFNQWDSSRAGKASAHPTSGLGFFMTADKGAAARYGNNLMALHAKIQNPYTLTDADLTSIETKEDANKLRKRLMAKGYDGAVVKAPGAKPYVIAFESKQVKFVTNEKPTDSPDFRYSMPQEPTSEFKRWSHGYPVVDAMIDPGKEAAFKTGEPFAAKVYHGSSSGNIEEFDPGTLGKNTGASSARKGFFFSGDPETASNTYYTGNEPGVTRDIIIKFDGVSYSSAEPANRGPKETALAMLYYIANYELTASDKESLIKFTIRDLSENRKDAAEWLSQNKDKVTIDFEVENPTIYPVYIRMSNPMVHDQKGTDYREVTYNDLIKQAKENGHDGLVILNTTDGGPLDNIFVVFDNKNIKGYYNRGTYDETGRLLYSFAGKNAKTADLMSLENAEDRIAKGEDKETVRQETGWHKGADGKWRFEISDESISFTASDKDLFNTRFDDMPESDIFGDKNPVALDKIINHPELFEAYPFLSSINVLKQPALFDPNGSKQGWFNEDDLQIIITPYAKNPLSTLLHEIQHVIQMYEGFAKGGSESSVWEALPNETKEQVAKDALEKLNKDVTRLSNDRNTLQKLLENDSLMQEYYRLTDIEEDAYKRVREYKASNPTADYKDTKLAELNREASAAGLRAVSYRNAIEKSTGVDRHSLSLALVKLSRFRKSANPELELQDYRNSLDKDITDTLSKITAVKAGNEKVIKSYANLYEFYKKLAGETEARLTQARQGMTAKERRQKSPESMQEYPNEEQIIVTQGTSAASREAPITRSVTPAEFRANIDSIMGEGWLAQAEFAGIIQVIDGKGTRGEAGSWDGNTFRIYLQSMPVNGSPAGVLLHEGSHAPTFKQILGGSIEGFLGDLDKLAANGNKAAQKAIMHATIASANVLGIKHSLDMGGSKEDFANVQALIEEQKPGLLAEEKLAYFIQYGSEAQSGAGFLRRLVNAIKAWFAQTQLGQVLKAAGIGFELNEGMAVEWAKMSLQRSLDNAQQAAKVREQVVNEAKLMPPSTRLGRALETAYQDDPLYSIGIQEIKDFLATDPTDSRVEMVNKPGLLQRWRADFIDFFAEIEKKSKTVYDAFTLLRNKVAARLSQSRQEYYLPLLKEIVGSKWTAKQVGDMLAARHHKVDKVNTRLAERASYGYTKELLKALPKTKRQELMAGRVNVKAGKMPDGSVYMVNGIPATMSAVTKQKLMFDLMNKYSQFEIANADGKQALREEWEIFKDAAGGFSDGGVAKGMVRTVDEVLAPASEDQARFDRIMALFDAMNRHALQIREDGGLITADEHARLLMDKSAYAPLKRESYNVNTETMRLFQQAGRGGSKNLGTRAGTAELSEPTNVLQNALALLEASAAAAERNLANQELYKVVNADKAAWKPWFHIAAKDEYVTHDEDGFLQEKNSTAVNRADIVLIKDGKKIVIRPNMHNERAMGFVRAANNLDAQDLSGPMKVLGMFNNIVRAVNITFSPVFLMMNAVKDPLTAAYNLQATEGAKHTKEIFVKDYFKTYRNSFRMLKKVFMDGNRDRTDADVKWVERYENAGGRTSFIEQLNENDNTWRSFDAQVARRQGNFKHLMAVKDTWIDGIENLNILFENVMRFSTFRVLVEKGMSDTDAARIAQDLTTNFSRRGYKSQALGLWWLFFNASVQGNYQVVRNLMKSKRLQVLSLGTIAFAVMLDLLGRAIADDWDEIPEWDKERFIIIPVKVGGDYVKIPAPWVYNTLWRTGGLIGEMFSGVKEPQDALLDMAAMTATTFNPLGKPGSIAQAIAPTAADPFIQILENKDFAGNPIGPEGYPGASKKANSELLWSSTPKGYQSIARFVNEVTGGSATESGGIDLKPGDYQLLAKFLTGSMGRFLTDSTFGFAEDVKKGIEGPKDIPVIREFFSDPYDPLTVQKYHTNIASIYGAHRLERMYREGPDRDLIKLQEVRSERGEELRMYSQAQDVERQLKSLRVRLKAAQARDDVGREKQLKERMAQVQEQFNAAYRQRVN